MKNKKKITIKSAIACLVLLVILISASFAYFGMFTVNLENKVAVNIYANDIGNTSFIATSANLNVIVPISGMFKGNTGLAAENTATLTVNLTGAPNVTTTCTYDVVYEYNLDSEIYGSTVNVTSGATKEITLEVSSPSGTNSFASETNFAYDSSWTPKTTTVGAKKVLVKGATIKSSGESTIQDINITGRYYNLDLDQSQLGDKSFTGTIYVENHNCSVEEPQTLYTTIAKRYNNGDEYVKLYNGANYGDTTNYTNNIYYFNGAVENNNVLFGGFCWKIIRTTETGGVKMIYNGTLNDGSCNNTETDTEIGTSAYNSVGDSLAYVGYMYNKSKVYTNLSKIMINSTDFSGQKAYAEGAIYDGITGKYTLDSETATTLNVMEDNISTLVGKYTCNSSFTTDTCTEAWYIVGYNIDNPVYIYYYRLSNGDVDGRDNGSNYVFGSSFTYANGMYTLTDAITLNTDTWDENNTNLDTHHYTCLTNGNSCASIYYVYNNKYDGSLYYITLTNSKSVDDAINEMLYDDAVNTDNSTIKEYIDKWYENNMTSYTDKLEDTVFCNDRSISIKNGWNPNGGSTTSDLFFKNYDSKYYSLACEDINDRFTVSVSNGNGALTYPVGLLTAPEVRLAYEDADISTYYLNTESNYWLISPSISVGTYVYVGRVNSGYVNTFATHKSGGVRPVISIKPGIEVSSGDGSYTNPFIIN